MSRAHRGYVKHAALLIAAAFITLPAFAATDVVTNLSDTGVSGDGSLRGEILAAAAGDTIVFAPGLTGTITLLTGTASLKFSGNCAHHREKPDHQRSGCLHSRGERERRWSGRIGVLYW